MNQPVPQSVPQQVSQQIPQPVQQVQQLPQTQSISQQVQPVQALQPQSVQPAQQQQQQVRPNDNNLLPHTPPLHPQARPQKHAQAHTQPHPQTHQQTHQQTHPQPTAQAHQQTPQLRPQSTPQPQHRPSPAHHESPDKRQETPHDDDMEVDSQTDPTEGGHLTPKIIDGTPFVPRSPMGAMMTAPPEGGSFPSLDAVHKHVLEYCTSVGYAVVIGRSKKTVPGLKKVLFVCDRAGKPPSRVSPEQRKRKTSSRKCNYQFGFFAIEQRTQWTIRYRPDQIHLTHNHGPSESPLLHPAARKLDSKMVAAVKQLKESGMFVEGDISLGIYSGTDSFRNRRDSNSGNTASSEPTRAIATPRHLQRARRNY